MHLPIQVNPHCYAPSIQPQPSGHVSLLPDQALCTFNVSRAATSTSRAASPPAPQVQAEPLQVQAEPLQ
ncbi:hypothetical protein HanXRQr2_Chr13g0618061 [Helianthus annuus]|uniref:Uncharacterized protein n=1 Tax=Helianthus annuus TaxID=4232 RepID=A0A9K3EMY9_HELAN|nr:hypothetical protein HanXRQr2_Chr13g0618061 [Helianthus annuus]